MADHWMIRVEGKDYGPADLEALREWKADGRVLPTNPARPADMDSGAAASAKEAHWQTAAEIPGLFRIEPPPIQAETRDHRSEVSNQKSRPPSRNILTETFRIYFRGFFQFLGLSLLSIVPIVCAELTSRFIDTAPGVNVDLRTMVAASFWLCMIVLWLVLWPIYIAGIQILSAELAAGRRIGFLSVLNGAVKYWPRVAGLCIFVYGIFLLIMLLGAFIAGVLGIAGAFGPAAQLVVIVIALGLLVFQLWLFCRFFARTLFWQQFAVIENLPAFAALKESGRLAHRGRDLPWYQRPLWRGALIFSLWTAFFLAMKITPEWEMLRNYFEEVMRTQDPQALYEKMSAAMQARGVDYLALGLNVGQRVLQPLLGIAFVVLYLDSKPDAE